MFKPLQRVKLVVAARNKAGHPIKAGSRLVVIREDAESGKVILRSLDNTKRDSRGHYFRIEVTPDQLAVTHRGRPRKIEVQ